MDQKGLNCVLFLTYLLGLLLFFFLVSPVSKILLNVLILSQLYHGGKNGDPPPPKSPGGGMISVKGINWLQAKCAGQAATPLKSE